MEFLARCAISAVGELLLVRQCCRAGLGPRLQSTANSAPASPNDGISIPQGVQYLTGRSLMLTTTATSVLYPVHQFMFRSLLAEHVHINLWRAVLKPTLGLLLQGQENCSDNLVFTSDVLASHPDKEHCWAPPKFSPTSHHSNQLCSLCQHV